jgi:hypothetical protein
LLGRVLHYFGRQAGDLRSRRHHRKLYLAALLERHHAFESPFYRRPANQQPVIAQDHRVHLAEIDDQALAFIEIVGFALVAVIGDAIVKAQRLLRQRQ